jgi:hypothetical protein
MIEIQTAAVMPWEVNYHLRVRSLIRHSSNIIFKSKLLLLSRGTCITILQFIHLFDTVLIYYSNKSFRSYEEASEFPSYSFFTYSTQFSYVIQIKASAGMPWQASYHLTVHSFIRHISNRLFKSSLPLLWRGKWNNMTQFIHLFDTVLICYWNSNYRCYDVASEKPWRSSFTYSTQF